MTRIVVIGNAAGGKSTLARHLARRRELPVTEVDRLLWLPGWQLAPEADYARRHAEIVAQDRWGIDGLGRKDSIAGRLARSTEIVLLTCRSGCISGLPRNGRPPGLGEGSIIRR